MDVKERSSETVIKQTQCYNKKQMTVINYTCSLPRQSSEYPVPHMPFNLQQNVAILKSKGTFKLEICLKIRNGLVPEQHNNYYVTRSTFLQHLNPSSFRINIRKVCPLLE